MSETVEDIKNMFVNDIGNVIVVDVSGCRLSQCKQIALLNVIRLQAKINSKTDIKSVQVKISDEEQRNFKAPANTNGHELMRCVLSDPALAIFAKI